MLMALLALGLSASVMAVVCSHNRHYGAAQGWANIQLTILWLYFILGRLV